MPSLARRFWLLIAAIAALMASTASPASALELENEATGEHCSAVALIAHGIGSGGCQFTGVNEGQIEYGTPLGMIDCDMSFQGRVGEDGEGVIFSANLFNCNPSAVVGCTEAGVDDNWAVNWFAEDAQEWEMCVVRFGFLTVNCHLTDLVFHQISHTTAEISTGGVHRACEAGGGDSIRGHWLVSFQSPGMEVID